MTMRDFVIMTDSCCDLTAELAEELGVVVLPLSLLIGNETYRNYLDGRLDNMNTNLELPVPWSGYYWTTTTIGGDASALYFNLNTDTRTWNGFDAAHAMHRANALPIRCVRE